MSEAKIYWKESPLMAGLYLLVIIAITFATWDSLVVMENRWATSEEYGYTWLQKKIVFVQHGQDRPFVPGPIVKK